MCIRWVSIPPNLSVSRAVQHLKGRSSHKLLSEFGILRKRYWGQHLSASGYWVTTSGNVTDEMWGRVYQETRSRRSPTTTST
nr:transposase [Mesorhizobium sp. LNJC391B00]